MLYETMAIIAAIAISTAYLRGLIGFALRHIDQKVQILDENLAAAISKTVENLPLGDFEPVNPIQAAIAQFLMNKVQSDSISMPERNSDGTFTPTIINEVEK